MLIVLSWDILPVLKGCAYLAHSPWYLEVLDKVFFRTFLNFFEWHIKYLLLPGALFLQINLAPNVWLHSSIDIICKGIYPLPQM